MSKQQIGIRELAERAKREGALDLAQGVIDADPPEALTNALFKLSPHTSSRYNNKRGVPEFRQAISKHLKSRKWHIETDSIIGTSGVMGAIVGTLLSEVSRGGRVLLPEPFFVYHKAILQTLGYRPLYFEFPPDSTPDWNKLINKARKADAAIITNPANPTGHAIPIDTLNKLCEATPLVLLDEVYRDFKWDEKTPSDAAYQAVPLQQCVVARSFSKTLAIPGWRAGFAVSSPERIERIATVHDYLYIGGSTLAQNALSIALTENAREIKLYIASLKERLLTNRELIHSAFEAAGMNPIIAPNSYYSFVKHNRENDIAAMEELLTKKIVTTPAHILYNKRKPTTGYLRIHFAVSPKTAHAVASNLGL